MSDPRLTLAFEGIRDTGGVTYTIDNSTITYSATANNGSAQVGRAVRYSTDDTVALCANGEAVEAKLILVEPDGKCTIQVFGYADLPSGNAATLTIGAKVMGATDAGSVTGAIAAIPETISASPTQAEVQAALKVGKSRAKIVNNDDTAKVIVLFG